MIWLSSTIQSNRGRSSTPHHPPTSKLPHTKLRWWAPLKQRHPLPRPHTRLFRHLGGAVKVSRLQERLVPEAAEQEERWAGRMEGRERSVASSTVKGPRRSMADSTRHREPATALHPTTHPLVRLDTVGRAASVRCCRLLQLQRRERIG